MWRGEGLRPFPLYKKHQYMGHDMDSSMKLLRENTVFWSKLGFCYGPPRLDKNGKPIVFNKRLLSFDWL